MTPAEERPDERRLARPGGRRKERARGRSGGPGEGGATAEGGGLAARHLRFGWWMLLVFLSLGIVLEALLAWRTQPYLAVGNETRRLLWRLAHAHGALLSLVNIAFGLTAGVLRLDQPRLRHVASPCLMLAAALIPIGFFLGGTFTYGSDPGLGTLLVPVGAVLLFVAVFLTALSVTGRR